MFKQSNKNICVLIVWSLFYVMICGSLIHLMCTDELFSHRTHILFFSMGILSILIWFTLLFGFMRFDGTKSTWWSSLLYDLFPYQDKEKRGTLFRDVILPSFICSLSFFLFSLPFLFFGMVVVGIVGYILLYNPIDFLFHNCIFGLYILISLAIIAITLTIIHSSELKKPDICYNRLAALRTVFCIDIYTIGYLLLLTGIAEGYFDVSSYFSSGCVSFPAVGCVDSIGGPIFELIVKLFLNLLPGVLLLFHCRRNLNFLLYAEDSYYLYLRSFQYDGKEDYLMTLLPVGEKQIMKIGNPSNSLFSTILSTRTMYHDILFLPSSNWQKHLDYYIHKAYSIISVIDDTQGVVWEMFHHTEYFNKIVFYVDSSEKLNKLETMIARSYESDLSPKLYYCIKVLNKRNIPPPYVFWIKDDRCYYETDLTIVSSLLSTKLDQISESYFDIDSQMDTQVQEEIIKDTTYYEDWNNKSSIIIRIRKILKSINTILPYVAYALLWLFIILFNIAIVVAIVWVCIEEYSLVTGIFVGIGILLILVFGVYLWEK